MLYCLYCGKTVNVDKQYRCSDCGKSLIWQELKKLNGKTIFALYYRIKNDILGFDDKKGMRRKSERGTTITCVPRSTFEKAWASLLQNGDVVPKNTGDWRVACACIAHLPEVEYSCKEGYVHLFLMHQRTHAFCTVKEHF